MPERFVMNDDLRACGLTLANLRDRRVRNAGERWFLPLVTTKLLISQLNVAGFDIDRSIIVEEKRNPDGFVLRQ